jgi:hypothetical protein
MRNPPACAPERIVETYRDHTATAQRNHHHGRIEPMVDAPIFTIPGFIGGVALVAVSLVGIVAVVLFVQAVVSFDPPAASPDANAPASSGTPLSHAGVR